MSQGYQWFAASDLKIFKSSNWKVVSVPKIPQIGVELLFFIGPKK